MCGVVETLRLESLTCLCKLLTSTVHKYSNLLPSTFVEAPLAAITALSLLGYDATSSAHLYLGCFSHSPLQILSSSVRLDEEHSCTAIFRSLQRCLTRFRSGLLFGPSRTFRDLSRNHSCVVLALCLGLLSCWKVNIHPEDLSTLEQVIIKARSLLSSVLSLEPD